MNQTLSLRITARSLALERAQQLLSWLRWPALSIAALGWTLMCADFVPLSIDDEAALAQIDYQSVPFPEGRMPGVNTADEESVDSSRKADSTDEPRPAWTATMP